jgi:hypothetical protein
VHSVKQKKGCEMGGHGIVAFGSHLAIASQGCFGGNSSNGRAPRALSITDKESSSLIINPFTFLLCDQYFCCL